MRGVILSGHFRSEDPLQRGAAKGGRVGPQVLPEELHYFELSALHPQGGSLFYTGTVIHGGTNAELAPIIAAQMEREWEIRDLQEKRRKKR